MPFDQTILRLQLKSAFMPAFLVVCALGPGRALAQQTVHSIAPSTELRVVETIPASVLWHAEDDASYDANGAFAVGVWPMASESQPISEGKRMIALVIVGRGDLRETPVAVEIWSGVDRRLVLTPATNADAPIRFRLEARNCTADPECAVEAPVLSVAVGSDDIVRMNDRVMGSIR